MIALAKSKEKYNDCEERSAPLVSRRTLPRGARCGVWRHERASFAFSRVQLPFARWGGSGGSKRSGPNVSADYAATHPGRISALGADDLLIALLRETAAGGAFA